MTRRSCFPSYGLAVLDIDGTLCRSDGTVSSRVTSVLAQVRARGGAVVLATGRPPAYASDIPEMVRGEVDFVICNNGTNMYDVAGRPASGWVEAVESASMSRGAVLATGAALQDAIHGCEFLMGFAHRPDCPTAELPSISAACSEHTIEMAFAEMGAGVVERYKQTMLLSAPAFRAGCDDGEGQRDVWSFAVFIEGGEAEANVRRVQGVLEGAGLPAEVRGWEARASGLPFGVDIKPAGLSKEQTVGRLLAALSTDGGGDGGAGMPRRRASGGARLEPADCIAFGDGLNDVGMLRWVAAEARLCVHAAAHAPSGSPHLPPHSQRNRSSCCTGRREKSIRAGCILSNDDIFGWVPLHACRVHRWAGCGVAMGNAEAPAVQAAADRVTASNDDDGVAVILEKMLASSATPSVRCYSRATAAAAAAATSRL
eukprot:COSAG01_NODE_843_length_13172_cov_84.009791_10_plen_428_part_00